MSRYIDSDELLKAMGTWDKFGFSSSGAFVREPENDDYVPYVHYEDMMNCVKNMPTADVAEVQHANWVCVNDNENVYMCDGDEGCGKTMQILEGTPMDNEFYYCPYCGAKMRDE